MKGLLIKDFKLMLGQKRFFLIVLGMGVMLMFTGGQPSSAMGYITMLLTIFTLSTISYDEHDNGMNFLLTLPVDRKTYVQEKFLFAGLLAVGASVVSGALACAATLARNLELNILEIAVVGGVMIVLSIVIFAVTLPLEIKFGAEKGRMAMFVVFAVIGIIVGLGVKIIEKMGTKAEAMIASVSGISAQLLVLLAVFALILVLLASYFICVRIINKKEY